MCLCHDQRTQFRADDVEKLSHDINKAKTNDGKLLTSGTGAICFPLPRSTLLALAHSKKSSRNENVGGKSYTEEKHFFHAKLNIDYAMRKGWRVATHIFPPRQSRSERKTDGKVANGNFCLRSEQKVHVDKGVGAFKLVNFFLFCSRLTNVARMQLHCAGGK